MAAGLVTEADSVMCWMDSLKDVVKDAPGVGVAGFLMLKVWVPSDVLVDGRSGPALWQDDDGTLWLDVSAGVHQVVLQGPLPPRDAVQIALPSKPHVISASVRGWHLAGVGDDGSLWFKFIGTKV